MFLSQRDKLFGELIRRRCTRRLEQLPIKDPYPIIQATHRPNFRGTGSLAALRELDQHELHRESQWLEQEPRRAQTSLGQWYGPSRRNALST